MIDKSHNSALQLIRESQTLHVSGDSWPKAWQEEDEHDDDREKSAGAYWCWPCIKCCIIASLICGIALAIAISLWLTTPVKGSNSSGKVSGISLSNSTQTLLTSSSTSTSTTTSTSISTSTSAGTSTISANTSTSISSTGISTSTISANTSTSISSTGISTSTSTNTSASISSTISTTTSKTLSTGSLGFCSNNLQWSLTGVSVAGLSTSGAAANQLSAPTCLYIDDDDSLYICDSNNGRIQKWSPNATSGITISNPTLTTSPEDVAVDEDGFVYVSDSTHHHVVRYPPGSSSGTVVAGKTNVASSALTNLNSPTGIIVTNNFTLYIIDAGNSRVVQWNPNATTGILVVSTGGITLTSIALVPWSSNQLYLSSESDGCVYQWTLHASTPHVTLTQINGGSTKMGDPWGIKTDSYGNLYVMDYNEREVFIYCPNSTAGHVAVGRTGSTPSLSKPYDVAIDSNFNLYVVDESKNQVFRYQRV